MTATIAALDAFALPYREVNDHGSTRFAALVRMQDSDGLVAWGEAATIFRGAALATRVLVEDYAELLLGMPVDPAAAMAGMRARGWWSGGAGIDSFAVSAVDMALWNLVARRQGRDLGAVLADHRATAPRTLPEVLSVHATSADLAADAVALVAQARDRGCVGVKVAFGKAGEARLGRDPLRDIAFVRALRGAAGNGFAVLVDIAPSLGWTVADVLARSPAFEEADVGWLEEPLGDRDPAGYAELRARTSLRLAYGEREWSVRGVGEILATGCVDVVGLDPGRVHGITGYLAAAQLCADAGVEANAHAFAGPLIHAAASAASAVSPACRVLEVAPARNDLFDLLDDRAGAGALDDAAVRARAV